MVVLLPSCCGEGAKDFMQAEPEGRDVGGWWCCCGVVAATAPLLPRMYSRRRGFSSPVQPLLLSTLAQECAHHSAVLASARSMTRAQTSSGDELHAYGHGEGLTAQ